MAGDWKKSNGLMFILIIVILIGGYLFVTRGSGDDTIGEIKETYLCTECGASREVSPIKDFKEEGFPPYECDECGEIAMWKAYDCSICKDEDGNSSVFAGKIEIEPPAEIDEDDATTEEIAQYNSQYQKYVVGLVGARCPKCGASAAGTSVRPHFGPEAEAERERQQALFDSRK